jgi:hypothetical protein
LIGRKNWTRVLRNLESKFGKFRSENQVKNFWSLRQRLCSRKSKVKSLKSKRKSQNKERQKKKTSSIEEQKQNEEQKQKQKQESVHLNLTYQYPSILSTMEPCVTFKFNEPNRMQPFF